MVPSAQGRPPFRADHVGSLLRPQALRQAFRQHAEKAVSDAEFKKLQDQCIRNVVSLQESVGLQVVTDGEFRRGSYWGRFVERTEGFNIRPASFKFRNDAGHEVEFTAPYAKAKIGRGQPLALDEFDFLSTVAKVTGKITLPAPSTMHFYRCNDFADRTIYPDDDGFFLDLAKKYPNVTIVDNFTPVTTWSPTSRPETTSVFSPSMIPVTSLTSGVIGFVSYGCSLVCFILALSRLGAARTGAYFATAPFVGAALSIWFLHEPVTGWLLMAGGLMAAGVWLHISEHHEHEHSHFTGEHTHEHVHDEHHKHGHCPADPHGEPHTHTHKHEPLIHTHAHFPDLHHQHDHSGTDGA
jgi:hypothetical protein